MRAEIGLSAGSRTSGVHRYKGESNSEPGQAVNRREFAGGPMQFIFSPVRTTS